MSEEEFGRYAEQVKVPLMANMTEFGKTPYLSAQQFASLGYRMVIFPMSAFRVMMRAVALAFARLRIVVEQGGAAALAAALFHPEEFTGDAVIAVATGGNVDAPVFAKALETLR